MWTAIQSRKIELLGHILSWDTVRAQEAREKAQAIKASVLMKMKRETRLCITNRGFLGLSGIF
jgi:hypothetical protein